MRGLADPPLAWQPPSTISFSSLSFSSFLAALVVPIHASARRFSLSPSPAYKRAGRSRSRTRQSSVLILFGSLFKYACGLLLALALVASLTAVFSPSYTHLPPHYAQLARNATGRITPGRANTRNEKVFIAASLYDPTGNLVGGSWGRQILELIDLLGPENTFLSIYESDSGLRGSSALSSYEESINCDHQFTIEDRIAPDHNAIITLADGAKAVKRMDYLAAARNKALEPLERPNATRFDKILYLNDIIFDPIEAAQLLFSTNIQEDGSTSYKAACALDFKSPFLMYDKLATRDSEGWGTGVPLYPFFSTSGSGQSRLDMFTQKDTVRVKSCWGGLVAFDAKNFQSSVDTAPSSSPVRFRSEDDLFWEYSECCLIHADLQDLSSGIPTLGHVADPQIYLNPYVRTAYTTTTFRWLSLGRRLEKLASPIQRLINYYARLPSDNERRLVRKGQPLSQMVYELNATDGTGSWNMDTVPALPGGFCGIRNLMVKRLDHSNKGVDNNWETIVPADWSEMPQPHRGHVVGVP